MLWEIYPFGPLGSAVPAPSPPSILPTPSLLTEVAKWETEKALMLCKDYSSVVKTLVCYQHQFGHQPKTQHCLDYHEENQSNSPPSAEPGTCWICSDCLHTPFNFQAPTFVLFHRTKCANKQNHCRILSSGNTLLKTWVFRSWLEMLHPSAINQDFLLVISTVIQPVPMGAQGCHKMRNTNVEKLKVY